MTLYADITLPLPLDQVFTYLVPAAWGARAGVGSRVLVPFGTRLLTGVIVGLKKRHTGRELKLKEVQEILDEEPVFSPFLLAFTRRLSDYYYSSWGELLMASLPPSFVLETKKKISLSEQGKEALRSGSLSREERKILEEIKKRPYRERFLRRKLSLDNLSYPLSRLEKKGLVVIEKELLRAARRKGRPAKKKPTQLEMDFSLDRSGLQAAGLIGEGIKKGVFSPFLIIGDRGKREAVYFILIRQALNLKKRALFLVPEISLTTSLAEKFEKKLGQGAAFLHSQLSQKKRETEWQKVKQGEVEVVVGPRSALFSPVENLGLIILDEEQDESYFQQESPVFDARKGAWLRASLESATLVFGSAAPSVESFYRAKKGGHFLPLESKPETRRIEVFDDSFQSQAVSAKLREKIRGRLERREQVLVFYNRRGFAPFLVCSKCRATPRCPRCDIALTFHRREDRLVCHYCRFSQPLPVICPECGSRVIRRRGFGIEAVEEELKKVFPESRIACFDTDLAKGRKEQEKILSEFKAGKIDVLAGTQLLAHQPELPRVSLVAALKPELALMISDFRAGQKAFQNLAQLKKFLKEGGEAELFIQTSLPQHHSILYGSRGDYFSFFEHEIKYRRLLGYPPFTCLAEVLFQGEDLRRLARESREFSARVKRQTKGVEVLGPALAPVSKIRGRSRIQVILKARAEVNLRRALRGALEGIKAKKSVFIYD